MRLHRRAFLSGLVAAPAIVSMAHIMPIRLWTPWYSWYPKNDAFSLTYDLMKDGKITGLRVYNFPNEFSLPDANKMGPIMLNQYDNMVSLIDYRKIYADYKIYTKNGDPFVDNAAWPSCLASSPYTHLAPVV